jgi:T-complex protein 1 subunit theta
LYAAHTKGQKAMGVDIESEQNGILDAQAKAIFDVLAVKEYAGNYSFIYILVKQATQVALTILSVDQIIMSKQAGGPKAPKQNNNWDE